MVVLEGYRVLLRRCAVVLALVFAGVVAASVADGLATWRRARVYEVRRERAAAVARQFAEASGADALLLEQQQEDALAERAPPAGSFPLADRLAALNEGVPAWRSYAASVLTRLRAAGCSQASLDEAARWNRATFVGRRRPAVALLREALSSPGKRLRACTVVASEALAAAQLHAEISRSQTLDSEANCSAPSTRILLLTYPWNGFASNFGVFAGALISAIRMRRVLVLDERTPWAYRGGPRCAANDGLAAPQWECYFARFGTCTFANAGISEAERAGAAPASAWAADAQGGPRVVAMSQESQFAGLFYHSRLTALRPPAPYARFGVAWWRAHHFQHLWRFQPRVLAAVRARLAASGLQGMPPDNRFLAWHVRHGDKVTEGRGLYRATKYARELDRLLAGAGPARVGGGGGGGPGVRDVFLASDNPAVLDSVRSMRQFQLPQPPGRGGGRGSGSGPPRNASAGGGGGGLRLFWLADQERLGASAVEAAAVAQAHPLAAYGLALDAIANIAVLSESALSLGIFHSNFGRLASELRYVKGYALAPFVFKDAPDCAKLRHAHPDRDSYFLFNASQWYLPLRAARAQLGLPPGYFLDEGGVLEPSAGGSGVG